MNVKIHGNELIFPVFGSCDEKALYGSLPEVLKEFNDIKIGESITGPWCDFRICFLSGKEFKIVYDADDDETYITSENVVALEKLRDRLMEAD